MSLCGLTRVYLVFFGLSDALFLYLEKYAFAQKIVLVKNLKWFIQALSSVLFPKFIAS